MRVRLHQLFAIGRTAELPEAVTWLAIWTLSNDLQLFYSARVTRMTVNE